MARIDRARDLAVLEIENKTALSALELSDSDSLIETQELVVFGFPFGKDLAAGNGEFPGVTVTTGHITALRKTEGVFVAVQMDAAIHPGNSGGPVLNTRGQVIGIVVARFTKAEGINLAIPVNHLRALCRVKDRVFQIGGKEVRLSQVQESRLTPAPSVVRMDGKIMEGAITGLGDVEADVHAGTLSDAAYLAGRNRRPAVG